MHCFLCGLLTWLRAAFLRGRTFSTRSTTSCRIDWLFSSSIHCFFFCPGTLRALFLVTGLRRGALASSRCRISFLFFLWGFRIYFFSCTRIFILAIVAHRIISLLQNCFMYILSSDNAKVREYCLLIR